MTDQRPPDSLRWRTTALAFGAYCTLAVLVTFPLVLHVSSQLPNDLGDPLIATTLLWWNAHVMPLTARWWDGFGFFPMHGMVSFSAHLLGASLIAAPLQWIGFNAVAAYNLTFLASFALCAITAYGLALVLARRADAAFVCGLAFGFNPVRIAHVAHLELLLAFGMPMALLALHRYIDSRQRRWLVVLAGAMVLQALLSSYYALFFTVFFALWMVWFVPLRAWRQWMAIGATGALAVLAVSPLIAGYVTVHAGYNWRRDLFEEVLRYSGDVTSYLTASRLSVMWGWTASPNGAERELFPGLTISALAAIGLVFAARRSRAVPDRGTRLSRVFLLMAAVALTIAAAVKVAGPWQLHAGWLHLSAGTFYKPLSLGIAFGILAVASAATLRAAYFRRSALAFYLVAAIVLFICSLGPQPTLLGERVLYEPPYAWLMRLPFFGDTIRAPARFAMPGILALSVAAALAFDRILRPSFRAAALVAVVAGVLVDGWMATLPLVDVPSSAYSVAAPGLPAAVLELPLGDVPRDTSAMFRSSLHGVRVVNGYNGFEPIAYQVLRRGLADADPTILDALASFGPILVAIDNGDDTARRSAASIATHPGVTRLPDAGRWARYWLPRAPKPKSPVRCAGDALPNTMAFDGNGRIEAATLTDQSGATRWIADDRAIVLDLMTVQRPCAIEISMGTDAIYYPGQLEVAASIDGTSWQTAFSGRMAGAAWLAALHDPHDARIAVPLARDRARFIRLRADRLQAADPWALTGVVVR